MAEENSSADPSMEEILASIRKIISDDAPVELVPAAAPVVEPVAEAAPPPEPPAEIVLPPVLQEDVVELTQMVQDDGAIVELKAPEPEPAPPVMSPPVAAPVVKGEPLLSSPAMQSAASALSALANTVEIERLASSPLGNTALGNGGRTLEDMVIELMRPLLKNWLDQNLPAVVDRLVQKEIERIARRA